MKVVNAEIGPELNSFQILNPTFMFHQPNVKLQALNLGCASRIFHGFHYAKDNRGRWVDILRGITTYLLAQQNTRACTADIFTVLIKVVMETIINCSLQKSQQQTATTMSNEYIRFVLLRLCYVELSRRLYIRSSLAKIFRIVFSQIMSIRQH